jgi:hypothetical protein
MPIDLTTSQALLKANATRRKTKRSESGALLQGKLFDDKGNLMSPSFSTKNACATGSISLRRCFAEEGPRRER